MYQQHAAVMGHDLWDRLAATAPARLRPARSMLLRQGDPGTHVLLLASGSALVTLTGANGEQTLLAVRGAGELLGELAVLDNQPRSASVIAAEECRVHVVAAEHFRPFVERHGLLAPLLRHSIARVREAETVRLELATAPVPARLASALGRLARASSAPDGTYTVRLTQAELAQMVGSSRNAVGMALKPWREQGWLATTPSGGLLVRDISAIQDHARVQR